MEVLRQDIITHRGQRTYWGPAWWYCLMVTTNRTDVSQHSSASSHMARPSLTLSGGLGFARDKRRQRWSVWTAEGARQRGGEGRAHMGETSWWGPGSKWGLGYRRLRLRPLCSKLLWWWEWAGQTRSLRMPGLLSGGLLSSPGVRNSSPLVGRSHERCLHWIRSWARWRSNGSLRLDLASVLETPQQGRVSSLSHFIRTHYVLGSGWMLHVEYSM